MSSEFPPVVILAGGLGTRLGAVSATVPKAMMPVAGRPFIAHQLALLQEQGVKEVVLCLSHLCEQIETFVQDGSRFGLQVRYSYDGPQRLGTGGAVKKALPMVPDHFAVLYGDTFLDIDYPPVYGAFKDSGKSGLMTVLHNQNRWDKSNIVFNDGVVVEYNKQSQSEEMRHIDYGLSILSDRAIEPFHDRQAFDLSDVFQSLISKNEMAGFEVKRRFYEIGTAPALAETDAYLTQRAKRSGERSN